jgi:hypothetical protein
MACTQLCTIIPKTLLFCITLLYSLLDIAGNQWHKRIGYSRYYRPVRRWDMLDKTLEPRDIRFIVLYTLLTPKWLGPSVRSQHDQSFFLWLAES